MAKKRRSLRSQVRHMIETSCRFGQSKFAARQSGQNTTTGFYSRSSKKNAVQFFDFMIREIQKLHPNIYMIRDLKSAYIQEFLDNNSKNWSTATAVSYLSLVKKFATIANNTYESVDLDFSSIQIHDTNDQAYSGRNQGMTEKEAEAVCAQMSSSSLARFVPEITLRIGTRLEEACSIRPEDIHLGEGEDYGYVHLDNTKGGKKRDVPIQSKEDYDFFSSLRQKAIENEWNTVTNDLTPSGVRKQIRKAINKSNLAEKYPRSGNHALRKTFARREYEKRLKSGMNKKNAWGQVQMLLGHGNRFRYDLFKRYIGKNERV